MALRLVPQERAFFGLFRRDIAACKAGVAAFDAMLADYRDLKEKAQRIHEIEHEGDRITGDIFALLNRTFITPFEREDIIALGSIVDDVLDVVDEAATMLVLYRVEQPTPYLREAGMLLCRAVESLEVAIEHLDSFKGIAPHVAEVHRLENEADGLYHNAIAELFSPGVYQPLEVMKLKSLYDLMEEAFDKCEDVGNVLENVVLKNG